jgi:hypothetical protein
MTMGTGIETMRAPRQMPWAAAVFALLVAMTVAIIATTVSVASDRQDVPFVGRHVVNTPADVAGGLIEGTPSGTAANTPSELRGVTAGARSGAGISFVRRVPRAGMGAADRGTEATDADSGAEWVRSADAIAESIASAERYDRHQRK